MAEDTKAPSVPSGSASELTARWCHFLALWGEWTKLILFNNFFLIGPGTEKPKYDEVLTIKVLILGVPSRIYSLQIIMCLDWTL